MTARGSDEQTQVPDARRLVALLAEPGRLRVFAALVLSSRYGAQPEELAKVSGVPVRDVLKALIRLNEAGLAELAPRHDRGGEPGGPGTQGGTDAQEGSSGPDRQDGPNSPSRPADDRWRATPETLRAATGASARQGDTALPAEPVVRDAGTVSVLRTFFARGRLTHVPAAHAKRMVVLDYLAQSFEPGVRYEEANVNEILGNFHDDYAALRRYLVDAGFLSRSENIYWRTGGSVGL